MARSGMIQMLWFAGACVGWLLLIAFLAFQYLRASIADVVPGIVSVVLGAILAYLFGLRTYFRKREHESILRRYLDGGTDAIGAYVDRARKIFEGNMWKADGFLSSVLKDRETTHAPVFETISFDFSVQVGLHRINELLGDSIMDDWVRTLIADVTALANVFLKKLPVDLPEALAKMDQGAEGKLVEALHTVNKQYQARFDKYVAIAAAMAQLSFELQKDTSLTWDKLDDFRQKSEMTKIVDAMREGLTDLEENHAVERMF